MSNIRAHVFIEGRVQGVGFRWWIYRNSLKIGLKGWVRNLSDGRVEAVFEGNEKKVEEMVKICKKGPLLSRVSHIDISLEKATGEFKTFEVKPTV